MSRERRNVAVLAVCQAFFMTSQTMLIILNGLVGHALLGVDKALATLPVSVTVVGLAMATIPASLLMKRIGRRAGFMIGTGIGGVGAAIGSYAIHIQDFAVFVLGAFVVGCSAGFAQYYRFAAADVASQAFKSKAISLVLAGGVVAAIVGPELTKWTNDLFQSIPFIGTYLTAVVLALTATAVLLLLDIPRPSAEEIGDPGRPLTSIARQPAFFVAVLGGMIAYGVMSMVMTATPLVMMAGGFGVDDAAFVIQWHVLAMFAPALVTGTLIQRFGVLNIMLSGTALLIACAVVALMGIDIANFWAALIAVGLGWNFTFIGASILLTEAYRPAERAKVQAANDFLVFGAHAAASLSSGALLHYHSWNAVSLVAIPLVLTAAAVIGWLALSRRAAARRQAPGAL